MIESLEVRGFKSLESCSVDLGLVNVFVGANGSGKSNFLEALGVIGAAADGHVDDESLLRRGVRPGLPGLFRSSFHGAPQPDSIQFEAKTDNADYAVELQNPIDEPRPAWRYKAETLKEAGRELSPAARDWPNRESGLVRSRMAELDPAGQASRLMTDLSNFAIYSPDTATLRGTRPDPQSREPVGLAGGRLAEAYDETLSGKGRPDLRAHARRRLLDLLGWVDHFGTSRPSSVPLSPSVPRPSRILRFADKYMSPERNLLSAYDASEGALYVLFAYVLAMHQGAPNVFAIDGFDHALNPRAARGLMRLLCELLLMREDRQALLTTHNPLVLDGLPLADDRVRLFAVDRSSRGKTVIQRVRVTESMLDGASRGVPLSQQWVMGQFGGVPNDV